MASLGNGTLILTDRGIELFPLLSCCEKLILMTSHKDVGLWTCQDDSWLFLWVWKAEDRSVGAIERNERLLFLRDPCGVHQWRQGRGTLATFPEKWVLLGQRCPFL